jgi:hypothetical protein
LRAAAKYSLYVERENPQQLDSVRADVLAAKQADATVTAKSSYFSPAFVQLFDGP